MSQYCYKSNSGICQKGENVFKIGKTTQLGDNRLHQYPKGTIQKIKVCVSNCTKCERQLIKKFDLEFKHRPDKGREYYEGEYENIEKVFLDITSQFLIDDENIKFVKKKPTLIKYEPVPKITLFCKVCAFYAEQKANMTQHSKTTKHKNNLGTKSDKDVIKNVHKCEDCKEYLSSKKTLKYHQDNSCKKSKKNNVDPIIDESLRRQVDALVIESLKNKLYELQAKMNNT